MPEINPVTKDQLFEKKIAENTGSNYKVGDISDIVPVTKDQALLKEIALNSAGQSGDITELEGKVADNTGAIEAIVNEYGSKNLLPFFAVSTVIEHVTWTVDNAKKIITVDGQAVNWSYQEGNKYIIKLKAARKYILSSGVDSSNQNNVYIDMYDAATATSLGKTTNGDIEYTPQTDNTVYFNIVVRSGATVSNVEIKPMIRDARITDPTYVPYAMTNEQLTGRVITNTNNISNIINNFGDYMFVPGDYTDFNTAPFGMCILAAASASDLNAAPISNVSAFLVLTLGVRNTDFIIQIAFSYFPDNKVYTRFSWAGWSPWQQISN